MYTLFFFIRTSNFDAEAERSYIFWRFEAETFLQAAQAQYQSVRKLNL